MRAGDDRRRPAPEGADGPDHGEAVRGGESHGAGATRVGGRAEGEWERQLVRTTMRRRVEAAKYVGGGLGVLGLLASARWGLVAHRAVWVVVLVFSAEALTGWLVDSVHERSPSWITAQVKMAAPAAGVTAIVYLIGWGPALAIGYVFPMLNMTFDGSARRAVQMAAWPVACLAVGQSLVATGTIHLLIGARVSWALSVIAVIAIALVSVMIAQIATGKEIVDRELAWAASHDQLTGLMNRSAFTRALERLVTMSRRTQRPVAVLFCDLLGFKEVNDRLGHDAGDRALEQVAARLTTCVRQDDLVARFGGDEFVIALVAPDMTHDAMVVADRILERVQEPIRVEGTEVTVGCSIGIAFCATGDTEADDLLSEADAAMYEAKAIAVPARVFRSVA